MSETFGTLLRHVRRRNGMTQSDLAARLGYSRSLIAALETDRRLPDIDAVITEYVPALNLRDARELAQHLVDLAARAHGTALSAAYPQHLVPRLSMSAAEDGNIRRVPTLPMPLLGREREVQTLCDRFLHQDVRLLTLVGPPGVGKTTLALAIAARLQYFLPDGACFVPLAGITNPEHIAATILDALGVAKWGGAARDGLVASLRRKELLLVLDNFEQILSAAPQVAYLIEQCAGIHVLVTSRERLHLRAEHVIQVQTLSLDAAVDLFLARAAAVNADLLLAEIDRPLTESICRRLDCLPLSIELCAAQADFLSFEQILERFGLGTLDTLVDGAADLPPRQRTLRATIQASYNLLNADERGLLQALSVFVGGCTPSALEEVWAPAAAAAPLSEVLRALVAKSLVQIETTTTGDKRVRLLEAVREFARERLGAEGDPAALRARHFDATLRFAGVAVQSKWNVDRNKRMNLEQENVQTALQWAYEEQKWMALVSLLYHYYPAFEGGGRQVWLLEWHAKLLPFVHDLGPDVEMIVKMNYCYYADGDRELRRSISHAYQDLIDACVDPLVKALALTNGPDLDIFSDHEEAQEALKQAVALARAERNAPESLHSFIFQPSRELVLPYCIFMYGCLLTLHGQTTEAAALLQESLALFHEIKGIGHPATQGYLGRVALMRGDYTEAVNWGQQAIASAVAFGDEGLIATWRAFLGQALLFKGDIEGARHILALAWDECDAYGEPFIAQIPALFLADLAFIDGNLDEVRRWLGESIALSARSSRDFFWRHIHRAMLATRLAAAEGDDRRAVVLYGFTRAYLDRVTRGPHSPVSDTAAPMLAEVRARIGEEAYQRAYEEGRDLPSEVALTTLLLPKR